MSAAPAVKDLVVLTADRQMEFAVRGLLTRGPSLGFRGLSADFFAHPERDPGCFLRGHDFLRPFCRQYHHAIVMLDREGCGRSDWPRQRLEREIEDRLAASGWDNRAAAVVLDPELEVWVWSDSPEVDSVLGWAGRQPRLADWLRAEGHLRPSENKPHDPKRAVEQALRIVRKQRSSAIYLHLAERVSVQRCVDEAFLKFETLLQEWFGGGTT